MGHGELFVGVASEAFCIQLHLPPNPDRVHSPAEPDYGQPGIEFVMVRLALKNFGDVTIPFPLHKIDDFSRAPINQVRILPKPLRGIVVVVKLGNDAHDLSISLASTSAIPPRRSLSLPVLRPGAISTGSGT